MSSHASGAFAYLGLLARHWRASLSAACLTTVVCGACVPSETDIRSDIRERLNADPTMAKLELSIEVQNRVVYLSGMTTTREEQLQAVALAREANGVKLVVNDMWLNNVALVDKVKAAIAADPTVGKIPLDIDAKEGTVRLMSDQTNLEERARLVEIASAVEGVKEVEDRMR